MAAGAGAAAAAVAAGAAAAVLGAEAAAGAGADAAGSEALHGIQKLKSLMRIFSILELNSEARKHDYDQQQGYGCHAHELTT